METDSHPTAGVPAVVETDRSRHRTGVRKFPGRSHWRCRFDPSASVGTAYLMASTSAGLISGGALRRRSALAIRATAIGPPRCVWRSASLGNASTIQKVVGSVRSDRAGLDARHAPHGRRPAGGSRSVDPSDQRRDRRRPPARDHRLGRRAARHAAVEGGRHEEAAPAAACTGCFALAEAGILDGGRATTSWWLGPGFRARYPGWISTSTPSPWCATSRPTRAPTAERRSGSPSRPGPGAPWSARVAQTLGVSPTALVQRLRVERAEHLLRTTGKSVDQIAPRVGYANGSTLRALMRRAR
jgi:Helix-turn-helix domain